jgi:hypothetical protein
MRRDYVPAHVAAGFLAGQPCLLKCSCRWQTEPVADERMRRVDQLANAAHSGMRSTSSGPRESRHMDKNRVGGNTTSFHALITPLTKGLFDLGSGCLGDAASCRCDGSAYASASRQSLRSPTRRFEGQDGNPNPCLTDADTRVIVLAGHRPDNRLCRSDDCLLNGAVASMSEPGAGRKSLHGRNEPDGSPLRRAPSTSLRIGSYREFGLTNAKAALRALFCFYPASGGPPHGAL